MTAGNALRCIRLFHKETCVEMASNLSVSQSTVSRFETGISPISEKMVRRIKMVYGFDVNELAVLGSKLQILNMTESI